MQVRSENAGLGIEPVFATEQGAYRALAYIVEFNHTCTFLPFLAGPCGRLHFYEADSVSAADAYSSGFSLPRASISEFVHPDLSDHSPVDLQITRRKAFLCR